MKRAQLSRKHVDLESTNLQKFRDLFVGGEQFEKNVQKYLLQNDREPPEVYAKRCKAAHYLNYCKPIGGYFASLLFSKELAVRTKDENDKAIDLEDDDNAFLASVDGKGTSLANFLRRLLLEAMQVRSAYFRVDFPKATGTEKSRAEWEKAGAGDADLTQIPRESLLNWRSDDDGWLWVMHFDCTSELLDPGDEENTVTETWTCYYRDGLVRRWQIVRREGDDVSPDDVIPEVPAPFNPTKQIPIVELALPDDLWVMGHLASPQQEHFRKRAALSWSIDRTCYALPVFFTGKAFKPEAMGAGYYLVLPEKARAEYLAPPDAPYDQVGAYVSTLKDEVHRVSTTMARGVDNNAAAVGRSGESKQADEHATEIVLNAFGRLLMQVAETTMRMRDRGIGRSRNWSAEGLAGYSVADPKLVAEAAVTAELMKIPSPTYRKQVMLQVVKAQIPNVKPDVLRAITEEIEDNVTPEDVEMLTRVQDPDAELDKQQDDEEPKDE